MSTLQKLTAVISLCIAGLGGLLALLITFAAGMKTVPHMEWSEVAMTLPLPFVAGLIAGLLLWIGHRRQSLRHYLPWTLPTLCIVGLSLFLVAITLLLQPGK